VNRCNATTIRPGPVSAPTGAHTRLAAQHGGDFDQVLWPDRRGRSNQHSQRRIRTGLQIGSVAVVTIASLAKGLLALAALLIVAGLLGGIGSMELLIWCGLVVAWIYWWTVSRRKAPSKP
jgi:hypothetical protein